MKQHLLQLPSDFSANPTFRHTEFFFVETTLKPTPLPCFLQPLHILEEGKERKELGPISTLSLSNTSPETKQNKTKNMQSHISFDPFLMV